MVNSNFNYFQTAKLFKLRLETTLLNKMEENIFLATLSGVCSAVYWDREGFLAEFCDKESFPVS